MIHTPGSFTQIAMAWKLNCIEFGEFSEKYREEIGFKFDRNSRRVFKIFLFPIKGGEQGLKYYTWQS